MKLRITRRPKHAAAVHSSSAGAKAKLRTWLVEQLGGKPRILDCFAGPGRMWATAYRSTELYLGIEKEPRGLEDRRRLIFCDSRRYLRHRATKLGDFDLFDLYAFGTPYEHLAIICSRLKGLEPGRRVGFCLTDGLGFNAAMNGMATGLLQYIQLERHKGTRTQSLLRDEIAEAAIRKAFSEAKLSLVDARRAEKHGSTAMRYTALLCERTGKRSSAGGVKRAADKPAGAVVAGAVEAGGLPTTAGPADPT